MPITMIFSQRIAAPPPTPRPTFGTSGAGGIEDFTIQRVFGIIAGFACWLTQIALFVMVAFILYYGFMFLKSQGNPEKLTAAKKSFSWGLVGVIVILGTYTIIATVTNALGGDISMLPLDCGAF